MSFLGKIGGVFKKTVPVLKKALPLASSVLPGPAGLAAGALDRFVNKNKKRNESESVQNFGNTEKSQEAVKKQAKKDLEKLEDKPSFMAANEIKSKIQASSDYADEVYARLTKKQQKGKVLSNQEQTLLDTATEKLKADFQGPKTLEVVA